MKNYEKRIEERKIKHMYLPDYDEEVESLKESYNPNLISKELHENNETEDIVENIWNHLLYNFWTSMTGLEQHLKRLGFSYES